MMLAGIVSVNFCNVFYGAVKASPIKQSSWGKPPHISCFSVRSKTTLLALACGLCNPLLAPAHSHPWPPPHCKALRVTGFNLLPNITPSQLIDICRRDKDVFLRQFVIVLSVVEWVSPLNIYTKKFYLVKKRENQFLIRIVDCLTLISINVLS